MGNRIEVRRSQTLLFSIENKSNKIYNGTKPDGCQDRYKGDRVELNYSLPCSNSSSHHFSDIVIQQ